VEGRGHSNAESPPVWFYRRLSARSARRTCSRERLQRAVAPLPPPSTVARTDRRLSVCWRKCVACSVRFRHRCRRGLVLRSISRSGHDHHHQPAPGRACAVHHATLPSYSLELSAPRATLHLQPAAAALSDRAEGRRGARRTHRQGERRDPRPNAWCCGNGEHGDRRSRIQRLVLHSVLHVAPRRSRLSDALPTGQPHAPFGTCYTPSDGDTTLPVVPCAPGQQRVVSARSCGGRAGTGPRAPGGHGAWGRPSVREFPRGGGR
jgi:hypothetical protein